MENNFKHHDLKPGQESVYDHIRSMAYTLSKVIEASVPDSREKSIALTKVEEAMFWANAGVARN